LGFDSVGWDTLGRGLSVAPLDCGFEAPIGACGVQEVARTTINNAAIR